MPNLTEAQKRALAWLPADGGWKINPGRLHAALESLRSYHRTAIEVEAGVFGPRGGWIYRYRLTPAGLALKAEMEAGNG